MLEFNVGTDIENISRFKNKTLENDKEFLNLIYTKNELGYCFSKTNPQKHLAVRYCGKEATVKALTGFGIVNILYNDIEILKDKNNAPYVKIEKYPEITVKISLSHSKETATAYVLAIKS